MHRGILASLLFAALASAQTYTVTTIAGGSPNIGDGGRFLDAVLDYPSGLAYDLNGNLLITDFLACRVRRVNAAGIISTIAGNGSCGPMIEGAPALLTPLPRLNQIVSDTSGNLFVTTHGDGSKILKIGVNGTVSTFAGTGASGFSGDNGPAAAAQLAFPTHLAFDAAGNLYVTDTSNHRVRKITRQGIISTFAGSGLTGSTGDGGAATAASITPQSVAFDLSGNLLIGENYVGGKLRSVTPEGIISTIAGKGTAARSGDGGQALQAEFFGLGAIAVDSSGIYVVESGQWIRKIAPNGIVTTHAGLGYSGPINEGPAAAATFDFVADLLPKTGGGLLAAEYGKPGRIFEITPQNTIRTVAGGKYRVGESARNSRLPVFESIIQDAAGNIYAADELHLFRIRTDGVLEKLQDFPYYFKNVDIAMDAQGRVFISDLGVFIWRWTPQAFEMVVGSTSRAPNDCPVILSGTAALSASTCFISQLAVGPDGILYFSVDFNSRVYKVVNGVIQLVAGNGQSGHNGNGGQATAAQLTGPYYLAVDKDNNLFIGEVNFIRKVRPNGIIETFAGNGSYTGEVIDGSSALSIPFGTAAISAGPQGDVYLRGNEFLVRIGADNRFQSLVRSSPEGLSGNGVSSAQGAGPGLHHAAPDGTVLVIQDARVRRYTLNTGATCAYTLSTRAMELAPAGGHKLVSIATNAGCNWTANSNAPWLTTSSATNGTGAGTLYFDVAAHTGAAPRMGTITIAGQTFSVLQQGTTTPAFAIRYGDVTDAAGFAFALSPNAYAAVKPKGMPVTTVLPWDNAVPDGVTLPILLNGVSIKLDNKNAAISYTSPAQINFLVPADLAPGTVLMELAANGQTAYAVVKVEPYAPGLFAYPFNGRLHAVAQIAGTATLVNATADLPGSRPAKAGDFLALYVNGLGGTAAVPPGKVLTQAYPVLDLSRVRAWIAGVPCEVQFAGAINSGLFQVNIKVPAGIPAGFQTILLGFDEAGSQAGTGLWMQ